MTAQPSNPSTRLEVVARRLDVLRLFLADAGRRDLAHAADNIAREVRDVARDASRQLRRVA